MVRDGENGFLCDPLKPEDIARALGRCMDLGPEDLARFGRNSRRMAEEMFNRGDFIRNYEGLYEKLLGDRAEDSTGNDAREED